MTGLQRLKSLSGKGFSRFASSRLMAWLAGGVSFVASTLILLPLLRKIPFLRNLGKGGAVASGLGLMAVGLLGVWLSRGVPLAPALFAGLGFTGGVQIISAIAARAKIDKVVA